MNLFKLLSVKFHLYISEPFHATQLKIENHHSSVVDSSSVEEVG